MNIHPTAIVETIGELGDDITIGAYAIVTGDISIGSGCRIAAGAQLINQVVLEEHCQVGPGSVIGGDPQDYQFDPSIDSGVYIGAGSVLREHVTIHRSSRRHGYTRLGKSNYLMVGCHIAHDVQVGNGNTLANDCLLGGHVTLGNGAFLGGGAVFHQFVRIGDLAMVRGNSGMGMDIPPFLLAHGINRIGGINSIGLRRDGGFTRATLSELRAVLKLFYRSGLNISQALVKSEETDWKSPEARSFLAFFRAESKRGICMKFSKLPADE